MERIQQVGNQELLERVEVIGFFASSRTAPGSVLPTLDWAHEVARRDDVTVMSGFQSPMEREVLDILLKGRCGLAVVLNRSIYRRVPPRFAQTYDAGRIVFLSLLPDDIIMPSKLHAQQRNHYIATRATKLVFSSITPASSLYPLTQSHPSTPLLIL